MNKNLIVACIHCSWYYDVDINGVWTHRQRVRTGFVEGVCPHCHKWVLSDNSHPDERGNLRKKLRVRELNPELVWGESPDGQGVIFA